MNYYDAEVKERWGGTPAHEEYQKKTAGYTSDQWLQANDGLAAIFAQFAACKKRRLCP